MLTVLIYLIYFKVVPGVLINSFKLYQQILPSQTQVFHQFVAFGVTYQSPQYNTQIPSQKTDKMIELTCKSLPNSN